MIERGHDLPLGRQAELVGLSRSTLYYEPRPVPAAELAMRRMRIEAIYRKPNTSKAALGHKIYPYLLRGLKIDRPNQVWAMDITYIPMARGFVYLAAVVDWFSRRVLSWRLSITMEVDFCLEALEEALARYGRPEIFKTIAA
jgi:putative transposase